MSGTLNGKTGLKATMVKLDQLETYDPFDESVVFEGTQKVYISESPEIRIRDKRYGPFTEEELELPMAAAVLLIAKGMAIPVK